MDFEKLVSDFKSGKPVIIFDDPKREGEADIVIHAKFATPEKIRLLRQDAGGLICLCTDKQTASKLGVGFYTDMVKNSNDEGVRKIAIEKTPYGDEPSFSVYINSRKVRTGITDEQRSLTVREFDEMLGAGAEREFASRFYAPGHVPLLISRGIENRHGHTEMSIELCKMAGMSPAVVICEMLADDSKALSWNGVLEYSKKKGFFAIMGAELLEGLKK